MCSGSGVPAARRGYPGFRMVSAAQAAHSRPDAVGCGVEFVAPGAAGWAPMLLLTAPLVPGPPPDADGVRAIVDAVFRFRWELEPGQFPPITLAWQTEGN